MMQLDSCTKAVLSFLNEALKTNQSVSFNDVMGAPKCKKYSVRDIGISLEFLRRNGFIKARSRFGCSELLEFTATEITDKGREYLKG